MSRSEPKSDHQVIAEVSEVAVILLRRSGFVCDWPVHQPLHLSVSSRVLGAWETAVVIYEFITDSCVQSALDNVEVEYELTKERTP